MDILIAEDDYISRKYLYTLLSNFGKVKVVHDGREAVNVFAENLTQDKPFDLVCLDIMMPEMDGMDTLTAIRILEGEYGGEFDPAKILMVTSLAEKEYVMKAMQMGCDGYILKPVDKYKLINKLNELGLIELKAKK
ncbi:response regulator [bacterium]|nr:response regulator [bacterium]